MKVEQFDIERYDDVVLKQILWQLCYNPLVTHKMGFGECNEEELKNFILTKAKENGRLLDFAGENPTMETYGVDIGIKNPIVRDYIIEKCHAVALINNGEIEKILRLLKTEEKDDVESKRRIHGGLREMDFTREEASYIQDTCNIHPIYLLLQRINQDLLDYIEASMNSQDEELVTEEVEMLLPTDIMEDVTFETTDIIEENEEKEEKVSVQDLIINAESIKEALQLIEKLENISKPLEEKGITLEYISSKKDYLDDLYKAIDNLK